MRWVDVLFVDGSVRMEFFEIEEQMDVVGMLEAAFITPARYVTTFKVSGHSVVLDLAEAVGYAFNT